MSVDYYLLAGTAISIAFFSIFLMQLLFSEMNFSFWHGVALGGVGLFVASVVQNHVRLTDWVTLGAQGSSIGASVFLLGMLAFIAVMVYNFLATRGKALVR